MKTDPTELYSITNLVDYAGEHTQRGLAFAWHQSRSACVRVRAPISREQGPNKLSLIPNPLARGQC
jgi:hypothetical protein